jgi:phosphopantetheine--protein transferase-like protein
VRIGVDLTEVARIERIAVHPAGRRLAFTDAELAHADSLGPVRRVEFLAGRFCAKEAVAKVLGHGLGQGLVWRDIEVLYDPLGAPAVRLDGGAGGLAARAGIERIDLSLSHTGGFVVGVAIAQFRAAGAGTGP